MSDKLEPGKRMLGMEFVTEWVGERGESLGTTKLYVDDEPVAPAPFQGGRILQVEVSIGDDQYVDLEKAAVAMLAREYLCRAGPRLSASSGRAGAPARRW